MAETKYYEYKENKGLGNIGLSLQVFGLITKIATEEVKDVALDMPKNSIFNVGKGPINCELNQSQLTIQIDVIIKYGKNVNKTIKELQDHVATAISDMTDVKVSAINVRVVGVEF